MVNMTERARFLFWDFLETTAKNGVLHFLSRRAWDRPLTVLSENFGFADNVLN